MLNNIIRDCADLVSLLTEVAVECCSLSHLTDFKIMKKKENLDPEKSHG